MSVEVYLVEYLEKFIGLIYEKGDIWPLKNRKLKKIHCFTKRKKLLTFFSHFLSIYPFFSFVSPKLWWRVFRTVLFCSNGICLQNFQLFQWHSSIAQNSKISRLSHVWFDVINRRRSLNRNSKILDWYFAKIRLKSVESRIYTNIICIWHTKIN